MSKFLNIFGPAAGGAASVLALAYVAADQFVTDIPSVAPRMIAPAEAEQIAAAPAPEAAPVAIAAPMRDGGFGLGRAALPEEVAAWDLDVSPDGTGLPEGRGDVLTGEEVFADNCAACHGDFAEGVDNWPKLAGGWDTLADKDPVKTVGSYWPYLSTVWDYVNRSMPFGAAQTLEPDDVYAIVAYILYSNDLVEEDFELSHENFTEVTLPNAEGFIVDDRAETEYAIWSGEPCMESCKESVEITMRATVLDVTPEEEGGADSASVEAEPETVEVAAAEETAPAATEETAPAAAEEPVAEAAEVAAAVIDPALVADGEKVFRKCKSCHEIGEGAKNKTGPHLTDLMGRTIGGVDGFGYSSVFQDAAAAGRVWDEESLAAFLAAPKDYMKGTKMSFAGLRKDNELEAVTAFIKANGG